MMNMKKHNDRTGGNAMNERERLARLPQEALDVFALLRHKKGIITQNEKDTLGRLPSRFQTVAESTLFYRFLCQQNANDTLFVGRNADFTDVMAVHKGEILLTNRFPLVEPADTLYYIYNVITQFHLQAPALYLHFFAEEAKKLIALLKTQKLNPNIV